MLLIGAGLLIRSFIATPARPARVQRVDVLTLELTLTGEYTDAATVRGLSRAVGAPGQSQARRRRRRVVAAPQPHVGVGTDHRRGTAPPPGERFINVDQRIVGGDYFRAMEIPLRRGRLFTEQDTRDRRGSWSSTSTWRADLAGGDAIGNASAPADDATPTAVADHRRLVGRVKQDALDAESRMAIYSPHSQLTTRASTWSCAAARPGRARRPGRDAIRALDPDLPIYNVRTMARRVDESLARRRFSTLLLRCSRRCAGARGDRDLRRDRVSGRAGPRGRHPHGARRDAAGDPAADCRSRLVHGPAGVPAGVAGAFVLTRFMRGLLLASRPRIH